MEKIKTVEDIQTELELKEIDPTTLAHYRNVLSGTYARLSDQLAEIEVQKPAIWGRMRKDHKSDTATERSWGATELGMQEIRLKRQLKKIEKMSSSIKSRLDIYQGEARNIF